MNNTVADCSDFAALTNALSLKCTDDLFDSLLYRSASDCCHLLIGVLALYDQACIALADFVCERLCLEYGFAVFDAEYIRLDRRRP